MIDLNFLISNQEYFAAVDKNDYTEIVDQSISVLAEKIASTSSYLNSKLFTTTSSFYKEVFLYGLKGRMNVALNNYIVGKRYTNTPFLAYMKKVINNHTLSVLKEYSSGLEYDRTILCPYCLSLDVKSRVYIVDKFMYCDNCKNESENSCLSEQQRALHVAFSRTSLHSIKCCNCNKTIPAYEETICPYCGTKQQPKKENKFYAAKIKKSSTFLLGSKSTKTDTKRNILDKCSSASIPTDDLIISEEFHRKYNAIVDVIKLQKIGCCKQRKMPNKQVMYDAIFQSLEKYPLEMVEYLINGGKVSVCCIQSLIFQEFVRLMEQQLPITHYYNINKVNITSLYDSQINMFDGVREFNNFANTNNVIDRLSQYTVVDGNLEEDNEQHFIGKIISIENDDGKDLSTYVDSYNFTQIIMGPKYESKGDNIKIRYSSIVPVYTLGPLLNLQRLKKRISDGAKKRLGG